MNASRPATGSATHAFTPGSRITALGSPPCRDPLQVGEKAAPHHDDAAVAAPEMFPAAVGDHALAGPREEILVHQVRGDPATGLRVLHGAHPVGNALLHVRLALRGHAAEEPADRKRGGVVHRNAPLEVVAGEERVRPQAHAPDRPEGIGLALALADALVDDAVLELLELEPQMPRRVRTALPAQTRAPVVVQPLEMHRVHGVFLGLEPVARHFAERDLHEAVRPGERLPVGRERRRLRAEIRPQQPGQRRDRVRLDANAFLVARAGFGGVLVRLLDAAAGVVVAPAVITAAQPAFLDDAAGEVRAAVRAVPVDEAVGAGAIPVEREILAEQAHRLHRVVLELSDRGDRMPVTAQQLAHRRAGADLRQGAVGGLIHQDCVDRDSWVVARYPEGREW